MHAQQTRLWVRGLMAASIALLLVSGCGGVDSGGTGAVSVGPITGFGSIIVNGVRFDDSAAAVEDEDGMPLARDRLQLGVTTQVDASDLSGLHAVANSIRVSSELVGPALAIHAAAGSLTVLGQTVLVTPATVFGPGLTGGLAALRPGTTVEVHARYDPARVRYTATRIEVNAGALHYKLRGVISAVDRNGKTLVIGRQKIDYSRIPPDDLPNVVVGNIVRAKLQPTSRAGLWKAVALPSGLIRLPDRENAAVEGRISGWISSRQFSVDGVAVDASTAAFPDGEAGVVLGARVHAKGTSSAGVLRARTVEFEGDENSANSTFELHGPIESIDSVAQTFRLRGVTVDYSGPVQYKSGTVADLAVGREVEVKGVLSSDGTSIDAQTIEFEGK